MKRTKNKHFSPAEDNIIISHPMKQVQKYLPNRSYNSLAGRKYRLTLANKLQPVAKLEAPVIPLKGFNMKELLNGIFETTTVKSVIINNNKVEIHI